ncbi:MAG: FAD-dependent oxidoreductase [Candidatus Rokubacteria bacterium]|nr:FAD-dependent oxidoreductase [Candidatus Rokubacteria bacterium]
MAATLRHVIIGAGTAALAAVEAIRVGRPADPITLLSAEPEAPYSPTVLPHLLAGRIDESRIALRPAAFFGTRGCRLLAGTPAVALCADRRVLRLAGGGELEFDRLLVASGSEPIVPALDNPDAVPVHTFTRLADLRVLRAALGGTSRVAVLGAGLIGMELAEAIVHRWPGARITVVEQERQVLPRAFCREDARAVEDLFESQGVGFRLGCRAVALGRRDGAALLTLSDGGCVEADLVVACVGVKPRLGFLAGAGLAVRRGIVVDRRMATSAAGIHAAGDVAEGPGADGTIGCHAVLPTAAGQGRVAGANMAGRAVEHEGWLPANVFSFFGRLLVSAGATEAVGRQTRLGQASGAGRGRLVLDGDRLVGASFAGMPADPGALCWLIRERVPVRAQAELLLSRPLEAARWLCARAQRGTA